MEYLEKQSFCKSEMINTIIDTNRTSHEDIFSREKHLLLSWLMPLENLLLFKALVLLNFNSYSGYFALLERDELKDIIISENYDKFLILLEEFDSNTLTKEMLAHNLWLARIIFSQAGYQFKYLHQASKDIDLPEKIINFKNKVRIQGKVYDLNTILSALLRNKLKVSSYEKEWLEKHYRKEIVLIKNFLEESLASEISNKGI